MPNIIIQQLPKDPAVTRDLVRRVTDAVVEATKAPAEKVHVWVQDYPADHYAVGGVLVADK